jgi:hypothetical protein
MANTSYKKPKKSPESMDGTGSGYPQTEIGLTGTKSKGRFIEPYGKPKKYVQMRGAGAATKGTKFYTGDEDMDYVKTKG